MWGFLYRATVGALISFGRGRSSFSRMVESFRYAATLPLVHLGLAKDFWIPFEWYLRVEKGLPATYYLIPFKGRPGERVPGPHPGRRACAYDLTDIQQWAPILTQDGCELGVHGIDAWHSITLGKEELERIRAMSASTEIGIRMHWLLRDEGTSRVLEEAGYAYDASAGYNETVGYRNGTSQVFMPLDCRTLLELPIHIQDGALFLPQRLNLSDSGGMGPVRIVHPARECDRGRAHHLVARPESCGRTLLGRFLHSACAAAEGDECLVRHCFAGGQMVPPEAERDLPA